MASKSLKPKKKAFKLKIAAIIFTLLGRAIKACASLDSRVKGEFQELPEGLIIKMAVLPNGPEMLIKKENGNVVTLKDTYGKPDLTIQFKNIEGALLALTGEESVAQSFAEQRIILKGDLTYGAAFVRIINIVEAYLFPRIWTAYIFNYRAPQRERSAMRILFATVFGK